MRVECLAWGLAHDTRSGPVPLSLQIPPSKALCTSQKRPFSQTPLMAACISWGPRNNRDSWCVSGVCGVGEGRGFCEAEHEGQRHFARTLRVLRGNP